MLFKTPVATLVSMLLVPLTCLAAWFVCKRSEQKATVKNTTKQKTTGDYWPWVITVLPPLVYFFVALTTNLNLGIRHILPIYPYIFLGLGIGAAALIRWRRLPVMLFFGVVFLGLAVENLHAYPNYIAFFNVPSGGPRGGLFLLGDSNLDWGQDLPALAAWQRQHPGKKVYLAYSGTADPSAAGIDCVNLPGGWWFNNVGDVGSTPGVIAMFATDLQGTRWNIAGDADYLRLLDPLAAHRISEMTDGPAKDKAYADGLLHVPPSEVLNGTVYLFEWPRPG
jgi:hypothetical protein